MCSDNDCRIFRGTIIACDACERNANVMSQMPLNLSEGGASQQPDT
jgi:hypothetical protein